jgi:SAM-dependent methyltransferase
MFISRIKEYLKNENFYPGLIGLFINPFFFARKELAKNVKLCAPLINGKVLDVGCGKKPYKKLFINVTEYIGMDIENPGHDHSNEDIDVFYDGKIFPFTDNGFDSILTNQVFEHVFNPQQFLSEINRVLKPDGYLLLTVPFMWDEHEQPNDFGRYSSYGIKSILKEHGFEVESYYKSCPGISGIIQLFNLYLYKKFYSKHKILNICLTILLISPFNLLGTCLSVFERKESDIFLDNVVLAKKKSQLII